MAFIACLKERGHGLKVVVGRDGRLSSLALSNALIEGLVKAGGNVLNIGCGPTPMLYFAGVRLKCDGAIQVTGSHNPPSHNGFKMVMNGSSFFGEEIQNLGKISAAGVISSDGGTLTNTNIFDQYVSRLSEQADAGDLSVVWDCGNGASGPAINALTNKLSGKHKILFAEIDGNFPNHHPNPVDSETLNILRRYVAETEAEIGIGFDGDGDRIGVIDKKGRLVPGDLLTAYLAQDILIRKPGSPVILDVKSSDMALDLIRQAGGIPEIWKTGHSHMKARLKKINAPIAGEMSGHIFISDDFYGFDDALYVATRVISQMVRSGQSITDFVDKLAPQHATPEIHISCSDSEKFTFMERLANYAKRIYSKENLILIDGVRVRTNDGWWLVRASNTEGALVLRAEGNNVKSLNRLVKNIESALAAVGIDWPT